MGLLNKCSRLAAPLVGMQLKVGPKSDLDVQQIGLMTYNFSTNEPNKLEHGQTLANRTKPGPSLQV